MENFFVLNFFIDIQGKVKLDNTGYYLQNPSTSREKEFVEDYIGALIDDKHRIDLSNMEELDTEEYSNIISLESIFGFGFGENADESEYSFEEMRNFLLERSVIVKHNSKKKIGYENYEQFSNLLSTYNFVREDRENYNYDINLAYGVFDHDVIYYDMYEKWYETFLVRLRFDRKFALEYKSYFGSLISFFSDFETLVSLRDKHEIKYLIELIGRFNFRYNTEFNVVAMVSLIELLLTSDEAYNKGSGFSIRKQFILKTLISLKLHNCSERMEHHKSLLDLLYSYRSEIAHGSSKISVIKAKIMKYKNSHIEDLMNTMSIPYLEHSGSEIFMFNYAFYLSKIVIREYFNNRDYFLLIKDI